MRWQNFLNCLHRGRWQVAVLLVGMLCSPSLALDPWPFGCGGGGSRFVPALQPQPHGSFVRRFQAIQADKAEASDFVVFVNEWYQGGTQLGPYGQYHLSQIAQRLPQVPFAVKVQPQADPSLNAKRREIVVEALQNMGVTDAETRVVIAYPDAEGIRYEFTERAFVRSLSSGNLYRNGYGGLFGLNNFSRFGLGGGAFNVFGLSPFRFGLSRPVIAGY